MKSHFLKTTTIISKPLDEVFAFFSKAENLNELTPPELQFSILTPLPIAMKKGALIDYKIKLSGIPMKWRTKISTWEPPFRFVDEQLKGPYVKWIHEHRFEARGNETIMYDTIEYLSPGWIFEPIVNQLFVQHKVEAIFKYREQRMKELFQ
jgi:ligand-binding SRPBCC domain-containing protein